MRTSAATWLLLVLAVAAVVRPAAAQQATTFLGQGYPPAGGATVYVNVILDRMLGVDDEAYRFELVLFMMFTWEDSRARPAMLAATAAAAGISVADVQTLGLDNSSAAAEVEWVPGALNSTYTCQLPCSSLYKFVPGLSMCCDGVWLPHLEFVNARGFSQDRLTRYSIRLPDPTAANPNAVAWWAQVQGEFYTPLNFRSYPFDKQLLVVQIEYASRTPDRPVVFESSTTGLALFVPASGDDLSAWKVKNLTIETFHFADDDIDLDDVGRSNPADPWPVHPVNDSDPRRFVGNMGHEGFNVVIQVQRISSYFVVTAVLPILLNVWLSLLVFSVSPKHLDTRLGVVVTLFLSLTALMYIVAGGLPQSSTVVPTQQLVVMGYFVLGAIGLESICVYRIVTVQRQLQIHKRVKRAQRQFLKRWDGVVLAAITAEAASMESAPSTAAPLTHSDGPTSPAVAKQRWQSAAARVTAGGGSDILPTHPAAPSPQGDPTAAATGAGAGASGSTGNTDSTGSVGLRVTHLPTRVSKNEEQFGAMGVFSPGSSEDDSEPYGGNSAGSSYDSSPRGTPAHTLTDEEAGREGRGCGLRRRKAATSSHVGTAGAAAGSECRDKRAGGASRPGWFKLQLTKYREMRREMARNADYALYITLKVDRFFFWCMMIGFNLGALLMLGVQATMQPALN